MTYALLSMSERHGLLAGIMCAGASPAPACAELTQPPAWFFAAVARPCLWAVGVQLPPHLARLSLLLRHPAQLLWRQPPPTAPGVPRIAGVRALVAEGAMSEARPEKHDGRRHDSQEGTTSCFLICRVFPLS